jgi:steroid 5-alpha reductase family enzyme
VTHWELFLLGWGVALTLLAVLYVIQLRTHDATEVDSGWGGAIALLAVLYLLLGPGELSQRLLIAIPVAVENARVAWLVRKRHGEGEDTRYQELRRRWRARGNEQLSFAVFYGAQGTLAALLSIPVLLGVFNHDSSIDPVQWAGLALWIVAFSLESLADRQLASFRGDPANKGKVMHMGLWHYSRHPNYFFQTLTWLAYALVALPAPYGWIAFFAPILILLLVLFVTGVPPAEESSLRSRGDAYRAYQRETSVFVPWFPKRSPTA